MTEQVYLGVAPTLEEALARAHRQLPEGEDKDWRTAMVAEWGASGRRLYSSGALLRQGRERPRRSILYRSGRRRINDCTRRQPSSLGVCS